MNNEGKKSDLRREKLRNLKEEGGRREGKTEGNKVSRKEGRKEIKKQE